MNHNKLNYLLIISLIVIVIAGGFPYYHLYGPGINQSLNIFQVKGYLIAFLASVFTVYFDYSRLKPGKIISTLLTIIGYFITFYVTNKIVNYNMPDGITFNLEIGFYLYILSAVLFVFGIIYSFLNNNDLSNNITPEESKIDAAASNVKKEDMIMGKMIYGIKGLPLYSPILLKNEENYLSINYVNNTQREERNIPYSDVVSLDFQTKTNIVKKENNINQNDAASTLLSYGLFGASPVAAYGINALLNSESWGYESSSISINFEVKLIYKYNNEECNLVFSTSKEPGYYIDSISKRKK